MADIESSVWIGHATPTGTTRFAMEKWMQQIQIYGHFSDYLSFGNISRALARVFNRNFGHGRFGIYEIGAMTPTYMDAPWPVILNSNAPVGVAVSYPLQGVGWLRGHDFRVLMTVCESDAIPNEWVRACNDVDLVVVPSTFCKKVFEGCGVRVPVIVVHHGVNEIWYPTNVPRGKPWGDKIDLLHVSGAASFPQRKGTGQLIAAWERLCTDNKVSDWPKLWLKLSLNSRDQQHALEARLKKSNINIYSRRAGTWGNAQMHSELAGVFQAVVQPSRGEGFGLLPLEARCAGTPAIMTTTTGHADHYAHGVDIPIETGPWQPMQTQGNDAGRCPTVAAEAVYSALKIFLADPVGWHTKAAVWATENREKWYWPNVLKPLITAILPHTREQRAMKAGEEGSVRGL